MGLDEATSWALEGRSVEESWNHGRVGGSIVGRGVPWGVLSLGMPALGTCRRPGKSAIDGRVSQMESLASEGTAGCDWALVSR